MGNIKNTKPFRKLTRVWGSTNTVRTADSYAEYLTAAAAGGDGRSPVWLANLVTCSMGGWISVPSQTAASIPLHSTLEYTHKKHQIPHQGAPTWVLFPHKGEPRPSMKYRIIAIPSPNILQCSVLTQWFSNLYGSNVCCSINFFSHFLI